MHSLLTHLAAQERARDMLARADRRRLARLAAVTRPSRSSRPSAD